MLKVLSIKFTYNNLQIFYDVNTANYEAIFIDISFNQSHSRNLNLTNNISNTVLTVIITDLLDRGLVTGGITITDHLLTNNISIMPVGYHNLNIISMLNMSLPMLHTVKVRNCGEIVKCISTYGKLFKEVPKNLKGRSKSSQEWLTRQLNDTYVEKAKRLNYRYYALN